MAYPLTGVTQTAAAGTVVNVPPSVTLGAVTRIPLPLSQAGSLLVQARAGAVKVSAGAASAAAPTSGQLWPRASTTRG